MTNPFIKAGISIFIILFVIISWLPAIGFCFIADWPGHWIIGIGFTVLAVAASLIVVGAIQEKD